MKERGVCTSTCYGVFSAEGETRGLREKRGSRGRARKGSDEDSPKKKKMKNRYIRAARAGTPSSVSLWLILMCLTHSPELSDALLPMQPSDVLDMPVDPNEPTYCLCHQVSYGEMIGCDNPDVSARLLSFWDCLCQPALYSHPASRSPVSYRVVSFCLR